MPSKSRETASSKDANDECRMTNDERMTKLECPRPLGNPDNCVHSALVIGHSFVIRHSSFVIPKLARLIPLQQHFKPLARDVGPLALGVVPDHPLQQFLGLLRLLVF